MSSSMNMEEAKEIAKKMTYRDAVNNALRGRCVPFKKATRIKLNELLDYISKNNALKENLYDKIKQVENEPTGARYWISTQELKNILERY